MTITAVSAIDVLWERLADVPVTLSVHTRDTVDYVLGKLKGDGVITDAEECLPADKVEEVKQLSTKWLKRQLSHKQHELNALPDKQSEEATKLASFIQHLQSIVGQGS